MKGLILSGGFGTGLRPITHTLQKQLIPIANKPIIFYVIEDLIEAGIKDIGIVVGPNKDQVISKVGSRKWKAKIRFITQDYPRGLAHAIYISRDFLGDDPFVVYLGDNVLRGGIKDFVGKFKKTDLDAMLLTTKVENPTIFGVIEFDKNRKIKRLLEKPKDPPSNYAITGIYCFRKEIFNAIENIKPSKRGELEITDSLQWLIDNKRKVSYDIVKSWWKDTGKPEDLLTANRLLLDGIRNDIKGKLENTKVDGKISIGKGSLLINSVVEGPIIVGDNCLIKNSRIGPYTTIGNNCEILSGGIKASIVMDNTKISIKNEIHDSIIGEGCTILSDLGSKRKFMIGDKSYLVV